MELMCAVPGCSELLEDCSSKDLCPFHKLESFTKSVRLIQWLEGNWDCFRRAFGGFCDRFDCYWRSACLANKPESKELAILFSRQDEEAELVKILAESPLFCILPSEELSLMVRRGGRSFPDKKRLISLLQVARPDYDDGTIQNKCLEIVGHA